MAASSSGSSPLDLLCLLERSENPQSIRTRESWLLLESLQLDHCCSFVASMREHSVVMGKDTLELYTPYDRDPSTWSDGVSHFAISRRAETCQRHPPEQEKSAPRTKT